MRSTFLTTILCLLLTACSTVNYMTIETYNPAEITFPESVRKILIVNNAVPQPSEIGYEYNLRGKAQDSCRANADSALFNAARSLGEVIMEKGFFEDVLLYHLPTRTDDFFYSDKKLDAEQVSRLCYENDANAIISIDRLLFNMKKNIDQFIEGYFVGTTDVKMSGVIRSYLPGRGNPLATVLVNDSIYWMESAGNLTLLNSLLPTPKNALRSAGEYIGEKIYPNFVPHWVEQTRWVYTGFTTIWKEASAFATNEKWENAFQRWNIIHERSRSWKEKAKTASNIALYYEINGNLEKAHTWANQSYELFLKSKGEEFRQTKLQKLYMESLALRMQADMKLDIQFGKE